MPPITFLRESPLWVRCAEIDRRPVPAETLGATIRADATLAIALPKLGTTLGHGPRLTGIPYLADIGIPASAFRQVGVEVGPIFSGSSLVQLAS